MAARLFLFHGSDSRASGAEARRWQDLFAAKHGDATRYVIDADELDPAGVGAAITAALQGQTLFPVPKLLLVRRSSARDQGAKSPLGTAVVESLGAAMAAIDDGVTVAVWEERRLAEAHPLIRAFTGWASQGRAKIAEFAPPEERGLAAAAGALAATLGKRLDPDALAALRSGYRSLERVQRLAKRTRPGESLAEDGRGWWLDQVIACACLLEAAEAVSGTTMGRALGAIDDPVGPFEVADALAAGRHAEARRLFARWSRGGAEEGDVFSLVAALRWRLERGRGSARPLRLLAQAELILKNFSAPPTAVLACFLAACEEGGEWLLPPRRLWLASLSR